MEWKKPELICLETAELLCKVKVRADSIGGCDIDYFSENECSNTDTEQFYCGALDYSSDDHYVEMPCIILTQCIEVGPAFGCNDAALCSTLFPLAK